MATVFIVPLTSIGAIGELVYNPAYPETGSTYKPDIADIGVAAETPIGSGPT